MIKHKIKLKELKGILDLGIAPKIETVSGKEYITDVYTKHGDGVEFSFDNGEILKCAIDHKMFDGKDWQDAHDIQEGHFLNGVKVSSKKSVGSQEWIDFTIDATHESYTHKGITHHNSGKSAIIYVYCRWHLAHNRRIILVVPTTGLVTQMLADFSDYASETDWRAEDHCHALYGGQEKVFEKPILIATWQSVHAMSKTRSREIDDFYKSWDVYIGDECHRFASNSLMKISEKLCNARYRLGTTGTVQDDKVAKLSLEGSFGSIHNVISTRELMDAGQVVDLKIKCIMLDHPPETKTLLKGATYPEEMNFLVTHEKRNKFISKLAVTTKGNTLVLFQFVEKQGKPLFDQIKSMVSADRPVFYISGETDVDERERIRLVMKDHGNAIIVGSFAVLSTGVNIPSIENIIFASPSKGKIRNLQSIGRGLRLKDGKTSCTLFDISDVLVTKGRNNHSLGHFKLRLEIYQSEQFKFDIIQYKI